MDIPNQLGVGLKSHRAPGFVIHGCAKPFQLGANPAIENDWLFAVDQIIKTHDSYLLFKGQWVNLVNS
jgi:hypothetical protein